MHSESEDLRAPGLPERMPDLKAALVNKKQEIEQQLINRKADLLSFHQQCIARGPQGKNEYFQERSFHEDWKSKATFVKMRIERKIALVKSAIRQAVQASPTITCPHCGGLIERVFPREVINGPEQRT